MNLLKNKTKTFWTVLMFVTSITLFIYAAQSDDYGSTGSSTSERQGSTSASQGSTSASQSRMSGSQSSRFASSSTLHSVNKLDGIEVKSSASAWSGSASSSSSTHGTTGMGTTTTQSGTTGTHSGTTGTQSGTIGRQRDMTSGKQGQKEVLGEVSEVILDQQKNNVAYVVVSSEGMYHPVPWTAFDTSRLAPLRKDDYTSGSDTRSGTSTSGTTGSATDSGTSYTPSSVDSPSNRGGAPDTSRDTRTTTDTDTRSRTDAWTMGQNKGYFVLNISKEQFHQAPSIDSPSNITQLSDSTFKQKIDSFYSSISSSGASASSRMGQSQTASRTGQSQTASRTTGQSQTMDSQSSMGVSQQATFVLADDVIDSKVQNSSNDDIAKIQDIIVDARQGTLAYCLVGYGGVLGIGQKYAAVPWSAIRFQQDNKVAILDATEDKLNEATIDMDRLDQLSDQAFAQRIYQNFGTEPYWNVYGYVPGESQDTQNQSDSMGDSSRSNDSSGSSGSSGTRSSTDPNSSTRSNSSPGSSGSGSRGSSF